MKPLFKAKNSLQELPIYWWALGVLLGSGLAGSYLTYVHAVKRINYQIFDLAKAISWMQSANGDLYRIESKGYFDSMLLTADEWSDFEWSFKIRSARECGVAFRYRDDENFHFIYFNEQLKSILFAVKKEGVTVPLKAIPGELRSPLTCLVKVKNNLVELMIDGHLLWQEKLADTDGKLALILRDALIPKTVFYQMVFKGHLVNGDFIASDNLSELKGAISRRFALPVLFLFMLLTAIYTAATYSRYTRQRPFDLPLLNAVNRRGGGSPDAPSFYFWWAAGIHLLLTVFLFWPFVFRGEILVSSADNFGEIFPLFFLSQHNFLDMIQGRGLNLWNPYTHNGLPFFSNHWNMIYYPLNWPVFLFPEAVVLKVLTARVFLEVFLLGLCAWGFFALELRSGKWAIFSSIVYQLCSLLIFALTVFPSISLLFAMTFYLWVLWSLSLRKATVNYILLTVAVILILTSANMAFIFYGLLALLIISVYRLFHLKAGKGQAFVLVGFSFLSGVLISAIRWLPCVLGILNSNRIVENYYTLHDRLILITRLFVPEIAGWFGANSLNALTAKNLNLIFEQANLPSNPQNTFFVYFGVCSGVLLVTSLFSKSKPSTFWKIYSWVTLSLGLLLQPFWGILSILTFPLNHYSYYIIILPMGICALVGHMARDFEEKGFPLKKIGPQLGLSLLLIQGAILVFVTYLFPAVTPLTRFVLLLLASWYVVWKILCQYKRKLRRLYLWLSLLAAQGGLLVLLFFTATAVLSKPIPNKEHLAQILIVPFLLTLGVIVMAMSIFPYVAQKRSWRRFCINSLGVAAIMIPIVASLVVFSPLFSNFLAINPMTRSYLIDFLLGQTRFLLIVFVVIGGVILSRLKFISRGFLGSLLIVLTAMDLLAFNLRFDNIVAPSPLHMPFAPASFPYQDMKAALKAQLDLVNYRCTNLHNGGLNSNKNLVFAIPSYTGIIGYMPKQFYHFAVNFGYPKDTILIYPEDSSGDERFLDLSAVRYDLKDPSHFNIRQTALSRLALLYSYQVVAEEAKLLEALKSDSFNPQQTVLLSQEPQEGFRGQKGKTAEFISLLQPTSDEVTGYVESKEPAIVLFSESYDPGWQAFVDGKATAVYPANYDFMACLVNAGQHEIRFTYVPVSFYISARIAALGLGIFVFSIIIGWMRRYHDEWPAKISR